MAHADVVTRGVSGCRRKREKLAERLPAPLLASADLEYASPFVRGSNGFVEAARQLPLDAARDPQRIRTERIGVTG